jgi:hypothetical protein
MKVRALPTCRKPVGDGANRTRSITFEYSGIKLLALAALPGKDGESGRLPTGYEGNFSVENGYGGAASHKKILETRAQCGTCQKTAVVSICLV